MKKRLTVLCAALALVLAACGGTAGESAPPAASATPSPAVLPVTVKYRPPSYISSPMLLLRQAPAGFWPVNSRCTPVPLGLSSA